MTKIKYIVYISLIFLAACSQNNPTSMPAIDVPTEELNTEFRVFIEEDSDGLRINQRLYLVVDVIGENQIIFPPDFGLEMFQFTDGEWQVVQDVPTEYSGGDYILSPSKGDPLMAGSTSVFPLVNDKEKPVLIRIFIFGHIYWDGKLVGDKVGGCVDVMLKP